MANLRARQSMFISMLIGGEIVFTGKEIGAAHARAREQGLNDAHFDMFLKLFRAAFYCTSCQRASRAFATSAGSPIEGVANCFRSVAFFSRTCRMKLLPLFSVSPQSGNAPAAMDL
jgi:hypothetical protein